MTDQVNTDGRNLEDELDGITRDYLNLQISAMLLQHAACMEMRQGSMENGLIMLESVMEMRKALEEQRQQILEVAGEEEMDASCERIGFEKTLYSSVSDSVLANNSLYFDIPPRPEGPEYACDEQKCALNIRIQTLEHFPELMAAA